MTHAQRKLTAALAAACLLTLGAGVAEAQEYQAYDEVEVETESDLLHRPDALFIEGHGAWGVQFGETSYLPASSLTDYQHPVTVGPGFGGSIGVMLAENVALMAAYDYTRARTARGEIPGVLERVAGRIDFHTAVAGLRLYVPVGYGALRAELGAGVLFPYHTTSRLVYEDGQEGAMGSEIGTRVDYYSIGFGGQAALGYQLPIVDGFYASLNLRYRLFESENAGERTEFENYLDADSVPPARIDGTVEYGDGAARPSTNSVQDVRAQLGFGYQW